MLFETDIGEQEARLKEKERTFSEAEGISLTALSFVFEASFAAPSPNFRADFWMAFHIVVVLYKACR